MKLHADLNDIYHSVDTFGRESKSIGWWWHFGWDELVRSFGIPEHLIKSGTYSSRHVAEQDLQSFKDRLGIR